MNPRLTGTVSGTVSGTVAGNRNGTPAGTWNGRANRRGSARAGAPAFGRPLDGTSVLHRRDPSVKFMVLLVVSAALTPVFDPWTPTALYALALPAVAFAGRVPWRVLARAHVPFAMFALSLFLANALTRRGDVVATLGPFDVTAQGLSIGASLAVRTLLIGTMSLGFVLTTDGARLMTSLHEHARLSGRFAYAVLAGYRLLEQLPDQWLTIRQAQAMRGPRAAAGSGVRLRSSPRLLARAAFTTLVVTLRRAERMSIALETRGLGSGRRTIANPAPLGLGDAVLAAVVVAVTAGVLAGSAALGWLTGWGALSAFG